MSSAFRNFILTLVLMLVVLGFAAWKLIPKLEDAVLKPIFNETSDGAETSDSEASANISDISAGETEVSNPTVPVEDTVFDCLFITKNDANDVCSAVYVYASKQSGSYVLCSFPVDMNFSALRPPITTLKSCPLSSVTTSDITQSRKPLRSSGLPLSKTTSP